MSVTTILSLLAAASVAHASTYTNETTHRLQARRPNFEWTAWGDSYASGVGAGDYVDGRRCLRYKEAYPPEIDQDPDNLLEGGDGGKFNNVVCSGAKVEEVEQFQFYTEDQGSGQPNWQYYPRPASGKPTMGTLTVGGDDIDFPGILNNCILEGFPYPLSSGFTDRTCDEQRDVSWGKICEGGNKDTPSTQLVNDISGLIKKILDYGKGASGDDFRLYVTGYGQFFNDVDKGCDTVTFARKANPNPDGKDHVMMTTDLRSDFNHMSRTLNAAIKSAVDSNKGATYIDIDAMLDGHRFCEAGIKEPDQDNPDLYFYHYPYNKDDQADGAIDYLNSVAEANVNSLTWDPKSTLYVDYLNEFWSKVDQDAFEKSVTWDPWPDTIGVRAKIFHPQSQFHKEIYKKIVNQYKEDVGWPDSAPPPTSAPPSDQPPKPDYAQGMCTMHINEWEKACLDDSKNLSAEIIIKDANGNEIGRTEADGDGNFPSINDGNSLHMKSKLPADLVVTGEHQNDYIQFTLETNPQLSWTSRTEQKDSADAYCHNGGWDPRQGAQCVPTRFGITKQDAKNQVDCWFKC